jgi:hypothetical protein
MISRLHGLTSCGGRTRWARKQRQTCKSGGCGDTASKRHGLHVSFARCRSTDAQSQRTTHRVPKDRLPLKVLPISLASSHDP